uniref:Reverse transcriptase domain-containing protein n=1 Tax=Stegastes partitus TaxID=144197 RepID=A0A3B5AFI2_9TELE
MAKCYLRGSITSYGSAEKKLLLKTQLELEEKVTFLEEEFKSNLTKPHGKLLDAARAALDQVLTKKGETSIFFARHRLYESGSKPGRLLARLARGEKTYTPHSISTKLRLFFYQNLYSSEYHSSAMALGAFLDKLELPSLTDEQKGEINRPKTEDEVLEAIKTLKGGGGGSPRPGWICQTSDRYECGSLRAISLVGVESKILSKVMATRREGPLPSLINSDQTGFIQNRPLSSNIRRLLNVIQYTNQHGSKALTVSLDAEKAFDRVEWCYLFDVLRRFGLGGNFLRWIQTIYDSPAASVVTNGLRSEPFPLARSTRQSCPLSPLLFATALEPLGVSVGNTIHKIALHANDVNFDKSEAMPIGRLDVDDLTDFPFRWSSSGLTYLGIKLSPNLSDLWKLNISSTICAVKRDLQRWSNLSLSFMGRISLIKMNVLPRILYPLQMLPLWMPRQVASSIEKLFSEFIWLGKKLREKN